MKSTTSVNKSDRREFNLPVGIDENNETVYESVTMFCQEIPGGTFWKFDINKIPRKEIQMFILGSLIQDAFQNSMVPVIKVDQRKTVAALQLPVLFVNEKK